MTTDNRPWRQYICRACGLIYDEQEGDPDSGLAPGTRFEDIPDDWECPLCGVSKADFELFERPQANVAATVGPVQQTGIVVVGAGIAGWATVEAIRALDGAVPVTLITACTGDRYHKPELSLAFSRRQNAGQQVRESGAEAARRLGIQLVANTWAVGISPALHQLRTTRGTFDYTRLVLAQGAKPMLPPELPPHLCWRINDLAGWQGLNESLSGGQRHVVMVGAGMVGCELAEDLARAGHQVTQLDRNRFPLEGLLPKAAGTRLRDALRETGIRYYPGVRVEGIRELDSGRRLVCLADGGRVECDQVVAATGLITDNRLARMAGLDCNRGIDVDPTSLQTREPDIFALGDCVAIEGIPCRFVEPIAAQASTIAHGVLDRQAPAYEHRAPVIRVKTRSLPIVIHGAPTPDGQWYALFESDAGLSMEQRHHGQVTASLLVGEKARANQAA